MAAIALVIVATVEGFVVAGPYVALVVAAALIFSLSDFLFPMRFILTEEKASCRMLFKFSEIKWADVKQCYIDDLGVKLSPLPGRSRLEAFRGVYLRFNGNNDEVTENVKALRQSLQHPKLVEGWLREYTEDVRR